VNPKKSKTSGLGWPFRGRAKPTSRVVDLLAQHPEQQLVIDCVEEFGQIHVDDRLNRVPAQVLMEVPDRIVVAAPWPS